MGDAIFSTINSTISIKTLKAILRNAGIAEATATSTASFLRNELHKPANSNYITERYSAYCHQYRNGHLSLHQLEVHIAFLALYAQHILKGKLSEGTVSQPWDISKGFHPALMRLATLGNPHPEKVQPIDPFSLKRMARNPYLFYCLLLDWICHHRGIDDSAATQIDTNVYVIPVNAEVKLSLAYFPHGEFFADYTLLTNGGTFAVHIHPEAVGVKWNTGYPHNGNLSFEMEELIAKMHPLGKLECLIPRLNTPTTLSA